MWQLLLKILEFVEWQYNCSKEGQIQLLSEDINPEIHHWSHECWSGFAPYENRHWLTKLKSAIQLAVLSQLFTWVALLPTCFATLLRFWYWQALDFMILWEDESFDITPSFVSTDHSIQEGTPGRRFERSTPESSVLCSCQWSLPEQRQRSPLVCRMHQSSFLLLSCISTWLHFLHQYIRACCCLICLLLDYVPGL